MDEPAPDQRYVAGSAAVQALLDAQAELSARLGAAIAGVEGLRCRVASEDEDVVAEVDGLQRVTDLYLEPGIIDRYRSEQLAAVINETVLAAGQLAGEEAAGIRARHFLPGSSETGQ
jgi:predicted alpha/beta-hydrolase family hydrolase